MYTERSSSGSVPLRFRLLAFLLTVSGSHQLVPWCQAEAQQTLRDAQCLAEERPAQYSTPVQLSHPREERPNDVLVANSIITTPLLECENECEVRFPDGVCRWNMTCFFDVGRTSLRRAATLETTTRTSNVEFKETDSAGGGENSSCRGLCVFEDVAGSCRLDLLCLLDKDASETRGFLERHFASEDVIRSVTARAG